MTRFWIGTAGWSISARDRERFSDSGSQLTRYAGQLDAVEINSSFYRPHRRGTYERWAGSVPESFRFAVKLPKTVTHERRLRDCEDLLTTFFEEVGGLGTKFAVGLVQLPPSLVFDARVAKVFFAALGARNEAAIACEPRHASWFTEEADSLLREAQVARVSADPPLAPGAERPGGWSGLAYVRLHGTPHVYHSDYSAERLAAIETGLRSLDPADQTWCIFDNTAQGHALGNALALAAALRR